MSDDRDDPFYSPTHRPPLPRVARPGEPLYRMRHREGRTLECQLRYHGEWGVETQFYQRGEFYGGRRFNTRAQALQWAELERQALEQDGWTLLR